MSSTSLAVKAETVREEEREGGRMALKKCGDPDRHQVLISSC